MSEDDNGQQLTVADLLKRMGGEQAPTPAGRRHRRAEEGGGVSVSELTGEIPRITADTTDPALGGRAARRRAREAEEESVRSAPPSAPEASASPTRTATAPRARSEVERPAPAPAPPKPEPTPPTTAAGPAPLVTPGPTAVPTRPQVIDSSVPAPAGRESARPSAAKAPAPAQPPQFNSLADYSAAPSGSGSHVARKAAGAIGGSSEVPGSTGSANSAEGTADGTARPGAALGEVTPTSEDAAVDPRELHREEPNTDTDTEPADRGDLDVDNAPEYPRERSSAAQWAILLAQVLASAVAGAALFVGFQILWKYLPWVAVALAVVVVVGLVAMVRVLRRSNDWLSITLAILVGLGVTCGPLLLVAIT